MAAPLVVAHAAAAGEAPANTLAGVRAALASADAIEIDLRLCADGAPVLLHDETLDRTTDLSGPVREASLAQLARADAGGGEPVPAFDEALALVAGRVPVFCELKAARDRHAEGEALLDAVLAAVRRHGAERRVELHSFDHVLVERARRLAPDVETAFIAQPLPPAEVDALCARAAAHGIGALSLEHTAADADAAAMARRHGVRLRAWTADAPAHWRRLAEAGVDGVITNHPARLRAWLHAGRFAQCAPRPL